MADELQKELERRAERLALEITPEEADQQLQATPTDLIGHPRIPWYAPGPKLNLPEMLVSDTTPLRFKTQTTTSTPYVEPPFGIDPDVYPFLRRSLSLSEARVELKLLGKPETLTLKQLYRCEHLMNILRETVVIENISSKSRDRLLVKYQVKLTQVKRLIEEREAGCDQEGAAKVQLTKDLKVDAAADAALAADLTAAIRAVTCAGYLYLNHWALPDGITWYAVGITIDPAHRDPAHRDPAHRDPAHRDAERNTLPVPAVTLKLVQLVSMDHARAAEKAIYGVLNAHHICEANNRELFHLTAPQLAALVDVMEQMGEEGLSAPP
jgi:hypothetical protein